MTYSGTTEITKEQVGRLLENHFSSRSAVQLTVENIQRQVEDFYQISHADLVGKNRQRHIAHARHVAIYLSRQLIDVPFADIGKRFNRDHSTVMNSYRVIEGKLGENHDLNEELETLRKLILEL